MIEVVKDKAEELAIIIDKDAFTEGVKFITPEHFPLQCGLLKYKEGESALPHIHPNVRRIINKSQEIIHVKKGRIKLDIFTAKGKLCASKILMAGDTAFFVSGGRGWTALEEAEILEIKQGPFLGKEDKIVLEESQE